MTAPTFKQQCDTGADNGSNWSKSVTTVAGVNAAIAFFWTGVGVATTWPTAVSYDGVPLTLVKNALQDGAPRTAALWVGILTPEHVGSKTLSVTVANKNNVLWYLEEFEGVNQSTPVGAGATTGGSSTSIALNVSGEADGLGLCLWYIGGNRVVTLGAGESAFYNAGSDVGPGTSAGATYKAGATTISFSETSNGADTWGIAGGCLLPSTFIPQMGMY